MLEVNVGKPNVRDVFKYGAGRKGGEATERAKNKFASAGGGERSGTGWSRASVVARGACRRYLLMYPGFDQSGVTTPISLCGGTCPKDEIARSIAWYLDAAAGRSDERKPCSNVCDLVLTPLSDL
jgi:hypothetical protein